MHFVLASVYEIPVIVYFCSRLYKLYFEDKCSNLLNYDIQMFPLEIF